MASHGQISVDTALHVATEFWKRTSAELHQPSCPCTSSHCPSHFVMNMGLWQKEVQNCTSCEWKKACQATSSDIYFRLLCLNAQKNRERSANLHKINHDESYHIYFQPHLQHCCQQTKEIYIDVKAKVSIGNFYYRNKSLGYCRCEALLQSHWASERWNFNRWVLSHAELEDHIRLRPRGHEVPRFNIPKIHIKPARHKMSHVYPGLATLLRRGHDGQLVLRLQAVASDLHL